VQKMRFIVKLLCLCVLAGCAAAPKGARVVDSPAELPSIQAEKSHVLSKLEIGMPLPEFSRIVPEAYVAGQSQETTAYEMVHTQKYVTKEDIDGQNFWWGIGSPRARIHKQVLWFYFYKGRLVQWGEPQDWPARPDLILEKRIR